jgi:hypothetical protein
MTTENRKEERPTEAERCVQLDLHGYHPNDIDLDRILQQAWERGNTQLTLIHGHARNRGITPGFVNTNTGYFGLCIRRALRNDESLRKWVKYTTLDCREMGRTSIRLKPNPNPTARDLPLRIWTCEEE